MNYYCVYNTKTEEYRNIGGSITNVCCAYPIDAVFNVLDYILADWGYFVVTDTFFDEENVVFPDFSNAVSAEQFMSDFNKGWVI